MATQGVECHANSNCRLFLNKDNRTEIGRELSDEKNYLTYTDGDRKRKTMVYLQFWS